jgi:hypothetical protein
VLRTVWRNHDLRLVEFAYWLVKAAESGTWLAMLVYAHAYGGVTEAGVRATLTLLPPAVLARVIAAVAGRFAPGDARVGA